MVTPDRVAGLVELTDAAARHRSAAVVVIAAAFVVWAYRLATVWGPVRVDRAVLRWRLSGLAGRSSYLRRRLVGPLLSGLVAGALVGGAIGLLMPDIVVPVVGGCAAAGGLAVVAAAVAQAGCDRSRGAVRPPLRLTPSRLHRTTFAPRDGYAGAVGLAVEMMDFSWMEHARVTRWMRRTSARSVRLSDGRALRSLVRLDAARMLRHPEAWMRAVSYVLLGTLAPLLLDVHQGAPLLSAILVYLAGSSFAVGLRTVSENRSLRLSFGIDDAVLRLGHAVVPVVATAAVAVVIAAAWQLGVVGAVVLVAGTGFAVVRRATRPELPYGGEVVADSTLTGAAFQPAMLAAQLRGSVAVVVTAVLVALVG